MTIAVGLLGGLRSFWQENVDVRPAERGRAWIGCFTLFGLVVTHELLETARHASFLERLSPARLPYAYLALAVAAVIWSLVARWVSTHVRHPTLTFTFATSAIGIAVLWFFFGRQGN